MPIFALRPGDIDFVSPTHGLGDISYPDMPNLPALPLMSIFEVPADLRRFSVGSGNYLSREIARHGGWLAMKNFDKGNANVGAFTMILTLALASIPQTFTKVMPYTNPYTGVPFAILDMYNFHRYGVEYMWE